MGSKMRSYQFYWFLKSVGSVEKTSRINLALEGSNIALVSDLDDLLRLADLLEKKDLFSLFQAHKDKINSYSDLCRVLDILNVEEECVIISILSKEKITSFDQFKNLMIRFGKSSNRLTFGVEFYKQITNPRKMASILGFLDEADRDVFQLNVANKVFWENHNIISLSESLQLLPDDLKLLFLEQDHCLSLITNAFELALVAKLVPKEHLISFMQRKSLILIIKNLTDLLRVGAHISRACFFELAMLRKDLITTFDQLRSVLEYIPEVYSLRFASNFLPLIKGVDQIIKIIMKSSWNSEEVLKFVKASCPASLDKSELINLLGCVSRNEDLFVFLISRYALVIKNPKEIIRFAHKFKSNYSLLCKMAKIYTSLFSDKSKLFDFIGKADDLEFNQNFLSNIIIHEIDFLVTDKGRVVLENFFRRYSERHDLYKFIEQCVEGVDHAGAIVSLLKASKIKEFEFIVHQKSMVSKIKDGSDLVEILRYVVPSSQMLFTFFCVKKIKNIYDLLSIFGLPGVKNLTRGQKESLLMACNPDLRDIVSILLGFCSKMAYESPIAQQLIRLGKQGFEEFLFQASESDSEDDFDYFLSQQGDSLFAFDRNKKALISRVSDSKVLSKVVRASRVAKIKASSEAYRLSQSARYIGINLRTIKSGYKIDVIIFPDSIAGDGFEIIGVGPESIQRFRQLIEWVKSHPGLSLYREKFSIFENNTAIRDKDVFEAVLFDFENFVATLAIYLRLHNATLWGEGDRLNESLATYFYAINQLGTCVMGVRSCLQNMTRSLSVSAQIPKYIDVVSDTALCSFISQAGICPGSEVHTSKDAVLARLGLTSQLDFDRYRLDISPIYLSAMANFISGQLQPELLIFRTLPQLETILLSEFEFKDNKAMESLVRDWGVLRDAGLIATETDGQAVKAAEVLSFIGSLTSEQAQALVRNYTEGNCSQNVVITLTDERLKILYWNSLRSQGIITMTPEEVDALKAKIWEFLTSENIFTVADNEFWNKLLNAPNGLSWIRSVIDSRTPEEHSSITLRAFLHVPSPETSNLFQCLVSDPFSAGWLTGRQISSHFEERVDQGVRLTYLDKFSFIENLQRPLATVFDQLISHERIMHVQLEKAFFRNGNLFFWLSTFKDDGRRDSTLMCILEFLVKRGGSNMYDSMPIVLREMILKGNSYELAVAESFLMERCKQQAELGLWNYYWQTLCYIERSDFKFISRDMLESLKDPKNIPAALYLANSRKNLEERVRAEVEKISDSLPLTGRAHFSSIAHKIFFNIEKLYSKTDMVENHGTALSVPGPLFRVGLSAQH